MMTVPEAVRSPQRCNRGVEGPRGRGTFPNSTEGCGTPRPVVRALQRKGSSTPVETDSPEWGKPKLLKAPANLPKTGEAYCYADDHAATSPATKRVSRTLGVSPGRSETRSSKHLARTGEMRGRATQSQRITRPKGRRSPRVLTFSNRPNRARPPEGGRYLASKLRVRLTLRRQ